MFKEYMTDCGGHDKPNEENQRKINYAEGKKNSS